MLNKLSNSYKNDIPFQGRCGVGFCKGNVVFIKRVYKKNIDLTRNIRKELIQVIWFNIWFVLIDFITNQIREMRHENINPFIGACIDSPNISIMFLYCSRGSLEVRYLF